MSKKREAWKRYFEAARDKVTEKLGFLDEFRKLCQWSNEEWRCDYKHWKWYKSYATFTMSDRLMIMKINRYINNIIDNKYIYQ